MQHDTLYTCDICTEPYNSRGTGGVSLWSWSGVLQTCDLCPRCLAVVREQIQNMADAHAREQQ